MLDSTKSCVHAKALMPAPAVLVVCVFIYVLMTMIVLVILVHVLISASLIMITIPIQHLPLRMLILSLRKLVPLKAVLRTLMFFLRMGLVRRVSFAASVLHIQRW